MVEYAVLLSLIALALVGPVFGLGQQVGNRFQSITNTLSNGSGSDGGGITPPPTTTTPPPTTSPTTPDPETPDPDPDTGGSGGGEGGGTGDQKWDGDHDDLSLPAYAVYSAEDKSLEFFRDKDDMPNVKELSRTGKLVTMIFTGFEDSPSPDLKSLWKGPGFSPLTNRINTVRFVDRTRPRNVSSWFSSSYYYNDTSIGNFRDLMSADLTKLDTSRCSDFSRLFEGQSNLYEIKGLEGLDTSRVTKTDFMFSSCAKLEKLDGVANWDTKILRSALGMFGSCTSLQTLDLSRWDTSSLELVGSADPLSSSSASKGMFAMCENLTSVGDISSWEIPNLTQAGWMFFRCGKLQTDCSKWVTPKIDNNYKSTFNLYAPGVKPPASWS